MGVFLIISLKMFIFATSKGTEVQRARTDILKTLGQTT